MKISVLGSGRWGSFIAWYLSGLGKKVILYGRENSEKFNILKTTGKNEYVTLGESVELSSNLEYTLKNTDITVISISSKNLRSLMREITSLKQNDRIIVLCMKGIEEGSGKRLSEVVIDEGALKDKVAVWVGPGHIQAFSKGLPNCMVIDGYNMETIRYLADGWRSDLIRFYYGEDIIGNEIGAAAKNVFGIAAGMLDGGGLTTLKGPLMARGAREISRLIKKMGGNELSAYGLCHLGDYETTLFSEYSNNRRYGVAYVKKQPFSYLAEGVVTTKGLKLLGEKYGEELPITNAVYEILYNEKEPIKELLKLFSRSSRAEF